jgi:hypothetical protein
MRVSDFRQALKSLSLARNAFAARRSTFRRCSDRISPHQGCLKIAVMLQGSPRLSLAAAMASLAGATIVFFDRGVALICVFVIGADKPV